MAIPLRFKLRSVAILVLLVSSLAVRDAEAFLGIGDVHSSLPHRPRPEPERRTLPKRFVVWFDFDIVNSDIVNLGFDFDYNHFHTDWYPHLLDAIPFEKIQAFLLSSFTGDKTDVESEVLLDVSHIFLDFAAVATREKPILDLFQIVGRVLVLSQDFLPDHAIHPHELAWQITMIGAVVKRFHSETKKQQDDSNGEGEE